MLDGVERLGREIGKNLGGGVAGLGLELRLGFEVGGAFAGLG